MKKFLLFFIPLLMLSACATKKPVVVSMPRSVPGTVLAPEGVESVRYGETVKAYPVGRYVDPNHRLVMHEAHTIYRVETTAQWNLQPQTPALVPTGPVLSVVDPARKEGPLTAEVLAEIHQQKAATQAVMEQGSRLNLALSQLSETVAAARQAAQENSRLQQELAATRQRLDAMEAQWRDTKLATPDGPRKGTNGW